MGGHELERSIWLAVVGLAAFVILNALGILPRARDAVASGAGAATVALNRR